MTTFKEIRGQLIRSVSSDPANPQEGQIWYNNTIGVLKDAEFVPGTFSSGGNLNTGRSSLGGAGTQSATLAAGGGPSSGGAATNSAEEYNGSSWTNVNTVPISREGPFASGVQTAAWLASGTPGSATTQELETVEYDGTNWTSGGNVNTGRRIGASAGTLTAGIKAGGYNPVTDAVEHYDGTSWTTETSMPLVSWQFYGYGTQTAAQFIGGRSPNPGTSSLQYDGTTWTSTTPTLNARRAFAGGGTQAALSILGGSTSAPPFSNVDPSEEWNGSNFVTSSNITTPIANVGGSPQSTQAASLTFGGFPTLTTTQEYVGNGVLTRTLTTS